MSEDAKITSDDWREIDKAVIANASKRLVALSTLRHVPPAREACPDCKLTIEPVEDPPGLLLTLTDKRAAWQARVTRGEIAEADARGVGDPIGGATNRLRQEQKKAASCRCNGTGVKDAKRTGNVVWDSPALPGVEVEQGADGLWRPTGQRQA